MIEKVRTVGFKGFDLDESVPNKVIYCGKNKSGKSTRAGAIAIALFGYIPFSTTGKRPSDILDSFGKGSLVAAVTINGTEFGRKFARNEKGTSQVMQVNGKRVSSENFAILLNKAGDPRIANVSEFMKQSEAKKVDTLFDLFPNPELANIDTELEEAKADISRLEKKKSGVESTVIRLTNSKQSIEIPSGSISEVQAEIKKIDDQIIDYEEKIKQAEIEEAEVKATEKANAEAEKVKAKAIEDAKLEEEQQEKDRAAAEIEEIDHGLKTGEYSEPVSKQEDPNQIRGMSPSEDIGQSEFDRQTTPTEPDPATSIRRIIGALTGSGCETCAALIVAKQELKKYKENQ